jgi:hypothetical protein
MVNQHIVIVKQIKIQARFCHEVVEDGSGLVHAGVFYNYLGAAQNVLALAIHEHVIKGSIRCSNNSNELRIQPNSKINANL